MGDNAIDPVKGSGDYCNLARDRVRGKIMEYLPDEGAVEGWLSHRGGLLRDGWDVQGLQCGAGSPRDLQLAGTRLEGNTLLRWEILNFVQLRHGSYLLQRELLQRQLQQQQKSFQHRLN